MKILASLIHGATVLLGFERASVITVSSTPQDTIMPENTTNAAATNVATTVATSVTDSDTLLANVKKVLTTAGHDVELVWDEVVALAKKLA